MVAVNFKLIKNFFTQEELNIFQKYCYNKLDRNNDYVLDGQSYSPSWYNDPLMNSILDVKLPKVEEASKLKLYPTYAYWRYYVFGASLSKHTDRPACEISITACIKKYDDWPIIVENKSFELEEGDAVLYAGYDQENKIQGLYKGNGMAQVFLHYVNQNGPFSHHAYDNINKNSVEIMKNKK